MISVTGPIQRNKRMTVPEAAKAYGVPDDTVRSWIRRNKIRAWRSAGTIYVDPASIEQYMRDTPANELTAEEGPPGEEGDGKPGTPARD